MAMKDDTRKQYLEEIYKGKRGLMQVSKALNDAEGLPAGLDLAVVSLTFAELWRKLEDLQAYVESPSVDTTDASNQMRSTMRTVNKFIAKVLGTEAVDEEEEVLANIAVETPMHTVIACIVQAGETLMGAYEAAVNANPMAENLELFKEIKQMSAKILSLPRDVAKIRGLS